MTAMKHAVLAGLMMAMLPMGVAASTVYKWVDEKGVVHYGDKQPTGTSSQTLNIRTPPPAAPAEPTSDKPAEAASTPTADDPARRKLAEEMAAAEKKARQERCDAARKNLEIIANNARIRVEENGQQRYLTPEEIDARKAQFEKIVEADCQ
ncbi:MAG: DUF4124 domain-containing protein [Gammaproteobacteria bacterium]|nr:DUF4124 domain-containing protein [Gammaproteobacteria bacterium]